MSIDNFFWVPSGIRNRNDDTKNNFLKTETPKATSHQVFIAHGGNSLVDEQYFFEDAKDARWFWKQGYKTRLFLDNENNPNPYDRMALWIDGLEVATRGYS